MNKKTIHVRSDPAFKKMISEIKLENMKKGKNLSDRRITLAMTRVPNLKEYILSREIKDE